jgi:hypothetical protein
MDSGWFGAKSDQDARELIPFYLVPLFKTPVCKLFFLAILTFSQ